MGAPLVATPPPEEARSALIDGILAGRVTDLADAAVVLGLPDSGQFVVIVGSADVVDTLAPRAVCRRGAEAIGIVTVGAGLAELRETLATVAGAVGVSTPITDLDEVPAALERARIARKSLPRGDSGVVVFGDMPVASLIAGAPSLAGQLAQELLARLLALPPAERTLLLGTLEAWYSEGGSAKNAGKVLYVHPNTVRYRIRRIEDLTGRDLDHPQCVAELYLALQAVRLGV
jgi:DNA-binding PucR family transcriptional regulator